MYQEITIVGNLGNDPELKYWDDGTAFCNFSVAVNKAKKDGEKETTWFRCTAYRGTAEAVAKYLSKGRQVLVVGEVKARAYEDKQGNPAASLDVQANTVKFLGSRDDDSAPTHAGNGHGKTEDFGDDIPF